MVEYQINDCQPNPTKSQTSLSKVPFQIAQRFSCRFVPRVQCAADLLRPGGDHCIGSGVPELDRLVGGSGFECGRVYEVFGPPDSGKTQMALSLAASCAASSGNVLYLDVKGDFSAARLAEIICARAQTDRLLDRVRLKRIFTLSELTDALDYVDDLVENQDPFWVGARLVVIDNLASLVLPELDFDLDDDESGRGSIEGVKEVFGAVDVAVGAVQRLASERHVCAVIVNNAVAASEDDDGGGDADCRPSLGRMFDNAADVRLRVTRDSPESPSRTVSVDKGIRLAPRATCRVRVTGRGWDEWKN